MLDPLPIRLTDWLVLFSPCFFAISALACLEEGRRCLLIEKESAYVEIARKRLAAVAKLPDLFSAAT